MSRTPKRTDKAVRRRKRTPYETGLTFVLVANFGLYLYLTSYFPGYVRDDVIYYMALVLLNVEGFLMALATQIHPLLQKKFALGVGLAAALFSVITIAKAYFESIQLRYLSFAETTTYFYSDIVLFGLFVGLYAVSVLAATEKEPEPPAETDDASNPSETEP